MDKRTLIFAGIAFVIGLALALVVFFGDSPLASLGLGGAPEIPVVARISDVGSRPLSFDASISHAAGDAIRRASGGVGEGVSEDQSLGSLGGQLVLRLHASTTMPQGVVAGDATALGSTGNCGARGKLVFRFDVDTSNGVAFNVVKTLCE